MGRITDEFERQDISLFFSEGNMASIKNFTPLLDSLTMRYGLVASAIWGRVWRYEQSKDRVCRASHERLGDGLGISKRTVTRHLRKLIDDGYIVDHTPKRRNKPHNLNTTEKARIEMVLQGRDEGMTQSHSGMTESHTGMTESHPQSDRESQEETSKKQVKKEEKKEKPGVGTPEYFDEVYKVALPPVLNTAEFLNSWILWEKHRKDLRKKLTPRSVAMQIKMLGKYSEDATDIIEKSIMSGWQGLFPPKNMVNGSKPSGKQTTFERNMSGIRQILEEEYAEN